MYGRALSSWNIRKPGPTDLTYALVTGFFPELMIRRKS